MKARKGGKLNNNRMDDILKKAKSRQEAKEKLEKYLEEQGLPI